MADVPLSNGGIGHKAQRIHVKLVHMAQFLCHLRYGQQPSKLEESNQRKRNKELSILKFISCLQTK